MATPILLHMANTKANFPDQMALGLNIARQWGANVISMSVAADYPEWYGTWLACYQPMLDANTAGIVQVAATGNHDGWTFFPAAYGEVMGVSAHNQYGPCVTT